MRGTGMSKQRKLGQLILAATPRNPVRKQRFLRKIRRHIKLVTAGFALPMATGR
jgi:hypothetical protein